MLLDSNFVRQHQTLKVLTLDFQSFLVRPSNNDIAYFVLPIHWCKQVVFGIDHEPGYTRTSCMNAVGVEPPHNKWITKFLGDSSWSHIEDRMVFVDGDAVILADVLHGGIKMNRANLS